MELVNDQIGVLTRGQVRSQMYDQIWELTKTEVHDQVWDQTYDQIWNRTWAQMGNQIEDQLMEITS